MKPIEATVSARMPASAPKPTALTNRIATITGWNERAATIRRRAGQLTHGGIRLRAASKSDRQRQRDAERRGQHRDLRGSRCRPLTRSSQRVKLGGNMPPEKVRRIVQPGDDALPRHIHLRARVDDVGREQQPRTARPGAGLERVRRRSGAHALPARRCASLPPSGACLGAARRHSSHQRAASPRRRRLSSACRRTARRAGRRTRCARRTCRRCGRRSASPARRRAC